MMSRGVLDPPGPDAQLRIRPGDDGLNNFMAADHLIVFKIGTIRNNFASAND
jgi:hypothetical protein